MSITVAFDVGPMAGRQTGIGRAVAALAESLADRPDLNLAPFLTSFRAPPTPGVRRLPIPAAVAHRVWQRTTRPTVDRWLGDVSVVHGTNYVVPPSSRPRLVSVYDCWFLKYPERAEPAVVRAGAVLRRAIASGAAVHTTSKASAEVIAEMFPSADVHTVHLGTLALPPSPEVAPIAELDGHDFIVSVATLERRKNLPRLVEAFGLIAAEHPSVRLVLAGGDGDDRLAIDQAIDRLPTAHSHRVLLTGFIDDNVRSWLLRHAAVVAYPSLDEGFGFPLLDAMQAGTPIVASHAGSIPEIAGDAAVLVAPHDVEALATALLAVLADDALRSRLMLAGAVRHEQFTWQAASDGLAAVYHQLAGGTR